MDYANIDLNFFLKALPALLANAALVIYALVRKPALWRYLTLFAITTIADNSFAGQLIRVGNEQVQSAIEYFFVLVGNLRYILLLAYVLYAGRNLADIAALRPTGDVLRPTLIFTLFPTLIVSAIGFAKPELLQPARQKLLAYELTFLGLTLLWIMVVLPQKKVAAPERHFIRQVTLPVLGFYGFWSLADILILRGFPVAYTLRVVADLLYSCVFLWWVAYAGPEKD